MAVDEVAKQIFPPANVQMGRTRLANGAATVALKEIKDTSLVFLTPNGPHAAGVLAAEITPGTGFEIQSTDAGDTVLTAWLVVI
jgi:hypothetical protein